MKNNLLQKTFSLFSVLLLVFFSFTAYGQHDTDKISSVIYEIIDYEKTKSSYKNSYIFNANYLKTASDSTSIRTLIALNRFGYNDNYYAYGAILKDIVLKSYETTDKLSPDKATPWHLISLGLMACGINPQDIKTESETIDLIEDGVWARGKMKPLEKDGTESLMRGLIVLDSYNTIIPKNSSVTYTRENLIKKIMSYQEEDGSFSTTSVMSDQEITAMAAIALAPYKDMPETFSFTSETSKKTKYQTVGTSLLKALEYLSEQQTEDGSFKNTGKENIRVTSKVITALCSLNLDLTEDRRFIKNGNTLIDGLLSYQKKNGSISENTNDEIIRKDNSYALEALAVYHRYLNNQTPFYDFTDCVFGKRPKSVFAPDLKRAVLDYTISEVSVSTDDYEEITVLIDKAENSLLSAEDMVFLDILKNEADSIYERKKKIDELNEQGQILSSPQTVMGTKNSHAINVFIKQYEALSESDKEKITVYEDVMVKKGSMRSRSTVVYIFIGILCLLAVAFVVFLAFFFLRSSPLWEYIYMKFLGSDSLLIDDYDDEDDDDLYEDLPEEMLESPLPYVDNDEFFEYDYPIEEDDEDDDFKIY